jgi:orotidine-5'-phosphate decarboxylase
MTDGTAARGDTAHHAVFGVRLADAMSEHGPLCAGIDPHRALVESWDLTYDLAGVERFALTCVEAFAGTVAAVKPQSAFFEVFGSRGVALLERVLDELRAAGTLTILDAKRGDIGTTMDAYADAFLGKDAPSPADALTVSPFLGYGSLRPAIDLALQTGRGVFVLALTSNPEGPSVQHAVRDGRSVAGGIVDGVSADNAAARERGELGSVGLVVGATVGSAVQDLDLDLRRSAAPLLAPGLGAQGATATDVARVFGGAMAQVLPTSSRGILAAGPDVGALRRTVRREAADLHALLT